MTSNKNVDLKVPIDEYNRIKELIGTYTHNLEQIQAVQKQIKIIKDQNKEYYTEMLDFVIKYEINDLNTEDYIIEVKNVEKRKPINENIIKNAIITRINATKNPNMTIKDIGNDKFLNELIEYINTHRGNEPDVVIKFKKQKNKKNKKLILKQ